MTNEEAIAKLGQLVRIQQNALETMNSRMEILRKTVESLCRMVLTVITVPKEPAEGETVEGQVVAGGFVFDTERLAALNSALRLVIGERTGSDPGPINIADDEKHTPADVERAIELLKNLYPEWHPERLN